MLKALKISSAEELFSDIPEHVRKKSTGIPDHISEHELLVEAQKIASLNDYSDFINFLGCGTYDRVVPSSVDYVISRTEFLTSYTPYQPEISQGVLQSLFEYQSAMSDLMEMDVTNSSMYDGLTALAEAVRMAYRVNGRRKILLPHNLYKRKLSIIKNYSAGLDLNLEFYRTERETGFIDLEDLKGRIDSDVSAVVVENPNSYGILDENVPRVSELKGDSLLISYVDPVSLGIVRPPGTYDTDIAVAEGQQLGLHQNYGGPFLGILSFKKDYARRAPGRLIGQSVDRNGKNAYVMTLQTREQHIRREKATSNICTNQALMAIAALSYVAVVGNSGLRNIATATVKRSSQLRKSLSEIQGIDSGIFTGTSFSDVPVKIPVSKEKLQDHLHSERVFGGIPGEEIMRKHDGMPESAYFFSVTEKVNEKDIDYLKKVLKEVL